MIRWIISSKTDIETYVANELGDWSTEGASLLVETIRCDDHPPWGRDWTGWLEENIDRLCDEANTAGLSQV
jgi:hypothetical protein